MLNNVSAAFGSEKVNPNLQGGSESGLFVESISEVLIYLIGFSAIVAIIFMMYAGFRIIFSNGDDEQVKKGKNTIIYALIGVLIMFLAWSIVTFFTLGLEKSA